MSKNRFKMIIVSATVTIAILLLMGNHIQAFEVQFSGDREEYDESFRNTSDHFSEEYNPHQQVAKRREVNRPILPSSQRVHLTLNPNGGSISPTTLTGNSLFGITWLPTPVRSGRGFIGWFNTLETTGGSRISAPVHLPSRGSATIFARWNHPNRHQSFWWPRNMEYVRRGNSLVEVTRIPIRSFRFSSTWQTSMNNGIRNWNSSGAPILFTTNATSNNHVNVGARAATWYGLIMMWGDFQGSSGGMTRFQIEMNSRTISQDATSLGNFITSVFAHELGHVLGLDDNPARTTDNGSLMNHRRNRNRVTAPTPFDVRSVNILYQ